MTLKFFVPALLLTAVLSTSVFADIVNTHVEYVIDATASVARKVTLVRMRNDGSTPVSEVSVFAPANSAAIVVVDGDRIEKGASRLPVSKGRRASADSGDGMLYTIALKNEIEAGEEHAIVVAYELLDAIEPSPKEISEGESHFVRFADSAYFASPYQTLSLTGQVKLTGKPVDAHFEAPEPAKLQNAVLKLGPYEGLPPFAKASLTTRFENNRGFLVANDAVREMYVSHWGTVAMTEEYEVENTAARHVGQWSRADYENPRARARSKTSIGDVWANLPRDATNVVYKDLVGNITTSRMRKPGKTYRPIQLSFRFPLVGGWKNHFWYTYDVPLGVFAQSSGSSHRLKVPLFPSINEDFLCRRLKIRVLLPEGASNIHVEKHSTIALGLSQAVEKTTLNYFGRTVVTLTAEKFYTNRALHMSNAVVTYDFAAFNLLTTPFFVASGIFALFLVVIAYAGTSMTLVGENDNPATHQAAQIADQELRIVAAIRALDDKYSELDELTSLFSSSKGSSEAIVSQRMAIESSMKAEETELAEAAAELKSLGGPSAEIASALVSRFNSKRDTSMRAVSAHLMLLEGQVTAETYQKQLGTTFAPMLTSLAVEIEALVNALSDGL